MSLLHVNQRVIAPEAGGASRERLVLPFQQRSKSRLRARLENGDEVGVVLERGSVLRGGDLLRAADGRVIEIVAAPEGVSVVSSTDAAHLARAAYHLGNRHVALQVGAGWLRYLHDHVLDDMLRGLGLAVTFEQQPFEPEGGAYSPGSQSHTHAHDQSHEHYHSHGHSHDHDPEH